MIVNIMAVEGERAGVRVLVLEQPTVVFVSNT
jgi:hypothetical protein